MELVYKLGGLIASAIEALRAEFAKSPIITHVLNQVKDNLTELEKETERLVLQAEDRVNELTSELDDLKAENKRLEGSRPQISEYELNTLREAADKLSRVQERVRNYEGLWEDEVEALRKGDKILAIRLYRDRTGLGLGKCKDTIEAYIAKNPESYPQQHGLAPLK